MITWTYNNSEVREDGLNAVSGNSATAFCLDEDVSALPTDGVPNGSCAYTMDGHKIYMFDAKNKRWLEQ